MEVSSPVAASDELEIAGSTPTPAPAWLASMAQSIFFGGGRRSGSGGSQGVAPGGSYTARKPLVAAGELHCGVPLSPGVAPLCSYCSRRGAIDETASAAGRRNKAEKCTVPVNGSGRLKW